MISQEEFEAEVKKILEEENFILLIPREDGMECLYKIEESQELAVKERMFEWFNEYQRRGSLGAMGDG